MGLFNGACQAITTRRDDDVVGVGLANRFPGTRNRAFSGKGQNGLTTSRDDEVGNPVAADERRVHPFQNKDGRPLATGKVRIGPLAKCGESLV